MNEPPLHTPEPESRSGDWLATLGKLLLWFIGISAVLTVLLFGTCLLLVNIHR